MTVKKTLVAHYEWVEDAAHGTWWADSPEVPGFYAAAPSLGQLQREAEEALRWSAEDDDLEVDWTTEEDVPEWAAAHVILQPGLVEASSAGSSSHRRSDTHQTFLLPGSKLVVRLRSQAPSGNYTLEV